jgi:hypothetical protein
LPLTCQCWTSNRDHPQIPPSILPSFHLDMTICHDMRDRTQYGEFQSRLFRAQTNARVWCHGPKFHWWVRNRRRRPPQYIYGLLGHFTLHY